MIKKNQHEQLDLIDVRLNFLTKLYLPVSKQCLLFLTIIALECIKAGNKCIESGWSGG